MNDLREAIQMWVELAVHKFHAADGVVTMGDCSQESVDEITKLFQAREQQLITELKSESLIYYHHVPNVDASTKTEWAVPVSVIQSKIGELNG